MKASRSDRRVQRGFTLIELLVVITIIALLASLGLVGGQIVMQNARKLEAKTVMKGFEAAFKMYRTEYLRMPAPDGLVPNEDPPPLDTSGEVGRALLKVLLARDGPLNPRGASLWEPPPAKSNGAGYSPENGLRDPWGKNGYRVTADYNTDGIIQNPYSGTEGEQDEL